MFSHIKTEVITKKVTMKITLKQGSKDIEERSPEKEKRKSKIRGDERKERKMSRKRDRAEETAILEQKRRRDEQKAVVKMGNHQNGSQEDHHYEKYHKRLDMDHDNKKVFETGVKRNSLILENNLYEIIQRDVAKPILSKIRDDVEDITFNFVPSGGKFYIPKKKSKLKVLTIRDLRVMYEEDILQTLPNELEKQQKLLLRKIKHGFAKDENTRSIAINLLKSNNPISRLSWQMLMNLNPEDKIHSSQYILWDGKCIRLNGSTGGRNKFICNYDVYRGMNKDICRKITSTRSKLLNKKRCLLRASLDVRFKPGPLSKKKRLDYSYQKYNVGEVKLVKLPKPGLHIQPMYGTPIEPTVKTFLQSLREDDGTISAKWAEFAVSMLGKNHILMRQDLGSFQGTINDNLISQELPPCTIFNESTLTSEVRAVVDEIVDAVEISLNKDLNYPAFDEPRDILTTSKFTESLTYDASKNEQKHLTNEVGKDNEVLSVPDVTQKESTALSITEISHTNTDRNIAGLTPYFCSRVLPYKGRNHDIKYYKTTNKKILEMEKHDIRLQAKMINILNQSYGVENTEEVNENMTEVNENIEEVVENTEEVPEKSMEVNENSIEGNKKSSNINKVEKDSEVSEKDGVKDLVDVANVPFKLDELLFNILQEQQKLMDSMNADNKQVDLSNDVITNCKKRLPNKTKLVQWLETSYKKYKEKLDKGFWKTSLSPPRSGKVALYPWNFILSRYRERKNLFLISKQKPFRIFMAVDTKNPFFSKCVNVNLIPRSHLDNYPVMIRNLLNDVKDQNETFCILCGLSLCWELVGSVIKVNENKREPAPNDVEDLVDYSQDLVEPTNNETNLDKTTTTLATDSNLSNKEIAQISKWFVMTIENDFIEIQFFKKGFFIKYDSIVRAIVASRQFGKTVRLSSQKCKEGSNDPQFGLYAIPNMHDNCVFIGPYEKDEPLGIEALRRPVIFPSKNKTRGMWITVNKVDNAEVINNPLSFMPSFNKGRDQVITFGNDGCSDSNHDITPSTSADDQQLANEDSAKSLVKNPKFVKPVKINKADCFKFPLKILTKPFPGCIKKRGKFTQENKSPTDTSLEDDMVSLPKETEEKIIESSNVTNNSEFNELLAKIPPQIKITNIASLCGLKSSSGKLTNSKRPEKGMFVLKPEEINERLAFNYFRLLQPDEINESITELPTELPHTILEDSATICSGGENSFNYATVLSADQDSLGCPANSSAVVDSLDTTPICSGDENSLESTAIYSPLTTDVCVISDEEDSNNFSSTSSWKEIWIMCTNIKNLGWVPGRRNEENKLSFRFPGFAFTDFYEEEVAFNKINQVFMRKVYVPKNITMKWRVVDNLAEVNVEDELNLNYLNADYVLTKHGLVHKNSLVFRERKRIQEDNNLWSSKKIRSDDENESDVDKIDIEYINLPEDKDNSDVDDVLGDEMKNNDDNKKGSDNVDKKEINNDTVFYKNIQDEDNSLFEDKEKMEEYRKVFGCAPAIASMSTRMKQFSTRVSKKLSGGSPGVVPLRDHELSVSRRAEGVGGREGSAH
ncbi:hypothetical protein RR48_13798 [Papilio machaon]|uniref:Uncharacterized protein n=1 Tax=Papilio machaon TaxID=76193 RepID=A0A194RH85_PAPMA|nr:hypothetical protein RR48_13798 [Papilio machaon]